MPRAVEEWIGKSDDSHIPPRVKLRIFDKHNQQCNECHRNIHGKLVARYDHIVALINGGANRESNIQLLCNECHDLKTKGDIREKSVIYNKRIKRLRLRSRRLIPGSKGSGIRRRMSGRVWKE